MMLKQPFPQAFHHNAALKAFYTYLGFFSDNLFFSNFDSENQHENNK